MYVQRVMLQVQGLSFSMLFRTDDTDSKWLWFKDSHMQCQQNRHTALLPLQTGPRRGASRGRPHGLGCRAQRLHICQTIQIALPRPSSSTGLEASF